MHERGFRTAIFNLGVLGGINLATPIGVSDESRRIQYASSFTNLYMYVSAGGIIEYGSYKIALHSIGGAFGLMFFLVFFFMPETAFHREGALNIDTGEKAVFTLP